MNYNYSIGDIMEVAEKKRGVDGWKSVVWHASWNGFLVEGCIPDGVYSRGPRKGRPRFNKPYDKVVVTSAEMDEAAQSYEAVTGKCWDCKGTGQVWNGWSKADGSKYRQCLRCDGSGEAQP